MSPGALFLLLLASPASADRLVTHCPEGSVPVRTPDPRRPWACVLRDVRTRNGIECPKGSQPLTTSDVYDPFKCAVSGVRLSPPQGSLPPRPSVRPQRGARQGL